MSTRVWFTPEKSQGLSKADCAILNRACRNYYSAVYTVSMRDLMLWRSLYKPGMSARNLIAAFELHE